MGEQRLERRVAARALPRAALGLMDTADRDTDRIRRQVARQLLAVRAVSDAVDDHGVDVEPEAEREHGATVAPPSGGEQAADPRRRKEAAARELASGDGGEQR